MKLKTFNKLTLGKIFTILSLILPVSCGTEVISTFENHESVISQNIPTVPEGDDPNFLTFFSNTYAGDPDLAQRSPLNPDKQFIKMIDEAKKTVDICAFYLDSENITNSIINAHKRGVKVRMVVDTDTIEKPSVKKIIESGIPLVDDQKRTAFMHNKFAIIDSEIVWTGSFNLTDNASWKHCDNSIKITNKYLAKNFIAEFEEMFIEKKFGRKSDSNVRNRIVRIGNRYVKTFFAPEDDVPGAIVGEISKAEKEIKFLSYSFTHTGIADQMIKKAQKGVKVTGIFENIGSNTNSSVINRFTGVKAKLFRYKNHNQAQSLMHHKVIIIDRKIVITGSFNFTYSATNENDENIVVITSAKTAEDYIREFERVKKVTEEVN